MPGAQQDPFLSPWFAIDFQGAAVGAFKECAGLGSEHAVVDHKASDPQGAPIMKKIPGNMKYTDVTLKRGMTDSMDIWKWRQMVEEGKVSEARKNGSIVLYSAAGAEIARWNLVNAWPSKITGPSVNAGSDEVAVEELTIVHEGYERVK